MKIYPYFVLEWLADFLDNEAILEKAHPNWRDAMFDEWKEVQPWSAMRSFAMFLIFYRDTGHWNWHTWFKSVLPKSWFNSLDHHIKVKRRLKNLGIKSVPGHKPRTELGNATFEFAGSDISKCRPVLSGPSSAVIDQKRRARIGAIIDSLNSESD